MKLSIVVPAYNESASLPKFYPLLKSSINDAVGKSHEIIIVNDGSTDDTLSLITKMASDDKNIKIINLSRNFGKEIAITAGIFYAIGEATIIIDADGQHPPELIKKFVKRWQDGSQIVVGVRQSNKREGVIKRYGSKIFYKIFNVVSGISLMPNATDFRLISEDVREEFCRLTEPYRMTRGLIDWMGFKRTIIYFHANERIAGKASYKISKLLRLAVNGFISLSVKPLYIIGYVGFFIISISSVTGVFIIIEQLIMKDPLGLNITGTAMLSVLLTFLIGIVLTSQGLIAAYLSHIHRQTQGRPLFIVDRRNSIGIK